ncbi:uncharacterized protein BKA55DRAFT_545505 [Fusarium redolens]|uniref:Reductase n=1 Tax=Fusarium redolens TaxID=48865 RepID=A0A9P9G0Z2_FUSRE|nr:uncharacterized protein BKA55DRAFT_545505 [Fusarium redolens]KAH7230213.1 hypothetical protein BKA55DRAFT_545505 [Fusarium redolens]
MSRYAEAHVNPQGAGDARPTALQIVKDEGLEGKLSDKVIFITGVSSGIGTETARALAATGARLFLTARNLDKAKTALADLFNSDGIENSGHIELIHLDQESLESVRNAAKQILSKSDKINILINNAGIMAVQTLEFTKDGHELQFGVNHLSHFLLFELLKPALLAGSTPEFNSRVINLSSASHGIHGINDWDNYNFQKGGYNPFVAYGQSKTANIYFANEIERRYGSQGLHGLSVHPGEIDTGLSRYLDPEFIAQAASSEALQKRLKSPQQGAATTVWAAISKQWEGTGGKLLNDVAEAEPADESNGRFSKGYAKHAYDAEKEARLWNDSLKLVGLV